MKSTRGIGLLAGLAVMAGACGGSQGSRPAGEPGLSDTQTGASATVRGERGQFVGTVQEMLQGRVAGLQVVDSPECGVTLRIRGMTDSLEGPSCQQEPLLIIDDKPVAPGGMAMALQGLLPVEIDRIRVLKDVASTSVYGTRAANGVVLIWTKK